MKAPMLAEIIRVDQSLDLNGGGLANYVVFRLDGGTECRAQVSEETLNSIVQAAQGERVSKAPAPTPPRPTGVPEAAAVAAAFAAQKKAALEAEMERRIEELRVSQAPAEAQPVRIRWMELPDNIISPMMKAAMIRLGLPQEMTEEGIMQATTEIAEKFTEADWKATLGEPPLQKAAPPISTAGLGPPPQPRVTYSDGTPIVPGGVPGRTVPKDEMGYPIVQNAGVDPGEVVGGSDTDEDGVGQF